MAKNMVVAGDYNGSSVSKVMDNVMIGAIFADKKTVEAYEVITEEHRTSLVSGIARGLVGGAILGPVGLLAGLTAKNKDTYNVAVMWKNGKKSLIEIDDKIYKALIKKLF